MQNVHYTLDAADPNAHYFHVRCEIPTPAPGGQIVSLPAWIPGSYLIRDFAKNIVTIRASSAGENITLTKTDKSSWQAAPCAGPLLIEYTIYAWDTSVRTAYLDQHRGFCNGTSVFLRVHGQEHTTHRVTLTQPDMPGWRAATSMDIVAVDERGFGHYQAADYDELVDHPIELGNFTHTQFTAVGVVHHLVLAGKHNADLPRLCADLSAICEAHITRFADDSLQDKQPPFPHYWFLVNIVGNGYGGLEHRASTALLCSRDDLPQPTETKISQRYRDFLGLCSHEYFHAWNIKRIRPAAFIPLDYQREQHTDLLWAFEGITSYYDDYTVRRAGKISTHDYLQCLAQTLTRVQRSTGRQHQTVSESSFDTWTKFYQQDENAPNAIVSYYTKGALTALALDLRLRRESEITLDDVMRALWQQHGKPNIGVTERGIETLASQLSGLDLSDFFEQALRSTDDLPLAELLADFGVQLTWRAAVNLQDNGGPNSQTPPPTALGARWQKTADGLKLSHVFTGGAAQQAGLAAGDVLVALDHLQCTEARLQHTLQHRAVGEQLIVHAFRRDELQQHTLTLQAPPADTAVLQLLADLPTASAQRRQQWLGT